MQQAPRYTRRREPGETVYRMKFMAVLRSAAGSGTTPLPCSFKRMSHAIFLPSMRMVCCPSMSCSTSPGSVPWMTFQ